MERKSVQEKIDEIEKKLEKQRVAVKASETELKRLKNAASAAERKARTKRLIEIGAVVEHVLGRPIEKSDLPALQSALEELEQKNNYWLTNTMQNFSAAQTNHGGNGQ